LKINPDCKINITAIENDPLVLAFSACANLKGINDEVNHHFNNAIARVINIDWFKNNLLPDVNFTEPFNEDIYKEEYKNISQPKNEALIHNIYYRTISASNNFSQKTDYNYNNLNITISVNDLKKAILDLNDCYDYIFHDAFTPSKVPSLWSIELFKEYHRLLNANGSLITYSSSSAVRSGLIEAGFYIGYTEPIGRKMPGTIACKSKELIKHNLPDYELGLLDTNSGIPYYDRDINMTDSEILEYRANIQKQSSRNSTTSYIKAHR
jgi:hypothetical protein